MYTHIGGILALGKFRTRTVRRYTYSTFHTLPVQDLRVGLDPGVPSMGNLIRGQDIWTKYALEVRLLTQPRWSSIVQLDGISLVQSLLYPSRWQYLRPTLHAYIILGKCALCSPDYGLW